MYEFSEFESYSDDYLFDEFMENPDFYNEAISTRPNGGNAKMNAYHELLPYYKELATEMENYSDEEIHHVKKIFTEQVGHFRRKAYKELLKSDQNEAMKHSKKRKYVSSSIPSSKKNSWNQVLINPLSSVNWGLSSSKINIVSERCALSS